MTNEDVVRMSAAGEPAADIIEAIRSAAKVAFDLDPDIVAELRRAHVEESVIQAMREASRPDVPEPQPAPEAAPMGWIALTFDDGEDPDPLHTTIVTPARDDQDSPVSLALFIYCVSPTHVPDLWQEHTPLSVEFPRHRLLLLHEETAKSKRRGREMIQLDKPEGRRIGLPAGSHNLVVGVAARSGDKAWVPLVEDSQTVEIAPDEVTALKIRLKTALRRLSGSPYICKIVGKAGEETLQKP